MEIARALAEVGYDDPVARRIETHAKEWLGFENEIGPRTDVEALAQRFAVNAADQLEIDHFHPSVEIAAKALLREGGIIQSNIVDRVIDPEDDRAAQYGDWRNAQREADELERDR